MVSLVLAAVVSASGCTSATGGPTPPSGSPGVDPSPTASIYSSPLAEFRYIGQTWTDVIEGTTPVKISPELVRRKPAAAGSYSIFMTDSIGFNADMHGGRMIQSLNAYYPAIGVEAIGMNAIALNDPYYDPSIIISGPEVNRTGFHVDSRAISATPNHYLLAMAAEGNQNLVGPKIFVSSSTQVTSYDAAYLNYPENGFTTWRVVQSKSGIDTPVNLSAFQMAMWLEKYGPKHNLLFVAALENNYSDGKNAVDCWRKTPYPNGYTPICGAEAHAITATGYGLESTLFVGYLDRTWNTISGWASGPYLKNSIYSVENAVDESNSHTAPTVGAFIAELVGLRQQKGLPEVSAIDWKRIILTTATKKSVKYIRSYANGVASKGNITINLLNKKAATACALTLACID